MSYNPKPFLECVKKWFAVVYLMPLFTWSWKLNMIIVLVDSFLISSFSYSVYLLEKLNLVTIRRFVTKLGNKNNCAMYFFIVVINSSYVQIQIKD